MRRAPVKPFKPITVQEALKALRKANKKLNTRPGQVRAVAAVLLKQQEG